LTKKGQKGGKKEGGKWAKLGKTRQKLIQNGQNLGKNGPKMDKIGENR